MTFHDLQFIFRPIQQWPGQPTRSPKRAAFRAGYRETLELLRRELHCLAAKSVVIQAYLAERDIRQDGMLRADSRPSRPGIILSFESKHGPLSYPCDRYTDWQDNLRAIALALEALRAVDRYGVTRQAEQYKGWQALPPPSSNGHAFESREHAWLFILRTAGLSASNDPAAAIRMAEMKTHPDRGGSADDFKRVQEARRVILGS